MTGPGDVMHADLSVPADKSLNWTEAAELDEITAAEAEEVTQRCLDDQSTTK